MRAAEPSNVVPLAAPDPLLLNVKALATLAACPVVFPVQPYNISITFACHVPVAMVPSAVIEELPAKGEAPIEL